MRQRNQKMFYDRQAKDLQRFENGENVRVKNKQGTWDRAIIVDRNKNDRAYQIMTEKGSIMTRNRIHLRNDANIPLEIENRINENIELHIPETSNNINMYNTSDTITAQEMNQNNIENMNNCNNAYATRSGRVSRQPSYLKDYELK